MRFLGAAKGKTRLFGRLKKCRMCNHRNTDIIYQGVYSMGGSDYEFIHSDCKDELIETYKEMFKDAPWRLDDYSPFVEDCKSRGITDPKEIWNRGRGISALLMYIDCVDSSIKIPL